MPEHAHQPIDMSDPFSGAVPATSRHLKRMLLMLLATTALAALLWAGTSYHPHHFTRTAAINQAVSGYTQNAGVDYWSGDVFSIKHVRSVSACADICCNVRESGLVKTPPDAYTWHDKSSVGYANNCYCKIYDQTESKGKHHAINSGKC